MKNKTTNRLIHSTSPYLLQHAHNPVDWYEWSDEALQKARQEDKPILVSIGYSSCHWCHVMERESFEIDDIAAVMNEFFVCIKVDREERPDIDQVYMDSVQALGINGGWPLNVFLTPEQKPFFGGTYFSPPAWIQILQNIHKAFQLNRKQIEDSAEELRLHLLRSDVERFKQKSDDSPLLQDLEDIYKKLETRFDSVWGGLDKAPKFVMPSIWLFLLRYHYISRNEEVLDHVLLTLKKIAMGGIYDQVGGGFSRYSVDGRWFAPHFEKMLYDNAQLVSLYAEAYSITRDQEFKTIIEETFTWLQREMTGSEGGFFSALDADSEGEEGKYYVWTKNELKSLLTNGDLISKYYNVQEHGNWEHGNNILFRSKMDSEFLQENSLTSVSWGNTLGTAKQVLLERREQRIKPGLDDKIITGWNAMMIGGLIDAYKALHHPALLDAAKRNLQFLAENLTVNTTVYRSFKGKRSTTHGFLDDYAYLIQAYLKMYRVTFDEALLHQAKRLLVHTLENFYDPADGFFFFSSNEESSLISRKKEIFDNVIPSSNALMAQNLYHLGILFDHDEWKKRATEMVESLSKLIKSDPNYMSQWAIVFTEIKKGMAEVVLLGKENGDLRVAFQEKYHPFALFMGSENTSTLPLLDGKTIHNGKSTIFVCYNKTCQRPVHTVPEAEKMLQ